MNQIKWIKKRLLKNQNKVKVKFCGDKRRICNNTTHLKAHKNFIKKREPCVKWLEGFGESFVV